MRYFYLCPSETSISMSQIRIAKFNPPVAIVHIVAWFFVFCMPVMFMDRENASLDWKIYLHRVSFPLSLCIVFYTNYLLLIPRTLLRKRNTRFFWWNVLLIAGVCLLMFYWKQICPDIPHYHPSRPPRKGDFSMVRWFFICQNAIMMVLDAGLAVALSLGSRWKEAETARQKAELGRKEAELKNLRNQINPHFLLNTLNNIYALTSFNKDKAQEAIQELSKLLRHILYDNQENYVDLRSEIEFLKSYIELMRIRVPKTVDVRIDWNVPSDCTLRIAPLIYISLIENAFKHGINPTGDSFIHIKMEVRDGNRLYFKTENSNFPKQQNDKSGSGVGLSQVKQRLRLLYPGRYEWKKGTDSTGNVYVSELTIKVKTDRT